MRSANVPALCYFGISLASEKIIPDQCPITTLLKTDIIFLYVLLNILHTVKHSKQKCLLQWNLHFISYTTCFSMSHFLENAKGKFYLVPH
jgi:hypothetical protein